jgi:hypothetical protein
MINPTGSLTINGITDVELAHILEVKAKDTNAFHFSPQALQPVPNAQNQTAYNNATFTWTSEKSLEIVHGIIGYLLKKEEVAKVVGQ